MEMDPQIPVELIKAIAEQNKNTVRIEKNLVQQNLAKDKTKSYTVQLGSSTLILSKTNESPISEAYKKQIVDQLCQMEQQKKLYNQLVTEEPLGGSKDTVNQIRGGDLDKGSSPGARARSDARKAITNRTKGPKAAKSKPGGSPFAEAFTVEPKFPARPGRNGDGLFGRFTPQPTPDPHNPGCAGGPRSITVLSGQRNSDSSINYSETVKFNDGYKAQAGNVQLDHILVKHGHQWGIDDIDLNNTRDANNNLFPGKPEQIRTRLTPENREKLRTGIQEMASSSKLESYPNYPISGDMGRAYLCPDTGLFIGIDKNNVIRKAYVASENLINYLRTNCI